MNEKKPYHHMNLRNALIEKGIEIVHSEGIKALSIRKVAAACGVSHTAPYSHFENKDALLNAMQLYITEEFSKALEDTIATYSDTPKLLMEMGKTYILFFFRNPYYFSFLYSQSNIQIDLSPKGQITPKYKPFVLFENAMLSLLEKENYSKEKQSDVIISVWAFIHGITALATMNNIHYDKKWEDKVTDFMRVFDCSFFNKKEEK